MTSAHRSILLTEYMTQIESTDALPFEKFRACSAGTIRRDWKHHGSSQEIPPRKKHSLLIAMLWKRSSGMRYGMSALYVADYDCAVDEVLAEAGGGQHHTSVVQQMMIPTTRFAAWLRHWPSQISYAGYCNWVRQ